MGKGLVLGFLDSLAMDLWRRVLFIWLNGAALLKVILFLQRTITPSSLPSLLEHLAQQGQICHAMSFSPNDRMCRDSLDLFFKAVKSQF